jgi:hypothetical protein
MKKTIAVLLPLGTLATVLLFHAGPSMDATTNASRGFMAFNPETSDSSQNTPAGFMAFNPETSDSSQNAPSFMAFNPETDNSSYNPQDASN